jgi:hypothetical protein
MSLNCGHNRPVVLPPRDIDRGEPNIVGTLFNDAFSVTRLYSVDKMISE